MIAAPCHGLVAIEDADRQLSTSALCRERGGVGRSLARFPVQEDRTGGPVRRVVLERVVRDEDQLVADRSILEALATGVPRYWSATWMGAPRDRSRSAAAGAIGRRRYIGVCMSRSCGIGPVRFGHVQAVETGDRTGRASRRRSAPWWPPAQSRGCWSARSSRTRPACGPSRCWRRRRRGGRRSSAPGPPGQRTLQQCGIAGPGCFSGSPATLAPCVLECRWSGRR